MNSFGLKSNSGLRFPSALAIGAVSFLTLGCAEASPRSALPPTPAAIDLNSGTFSWPNGVQMSIEVTRYGPIGAVLGDEYWDLEEYGEGAQLLALKYTISVPEDYGRSFSRTGSYCPGTLTSLNGSGESVTAVAFLGDTSPGVDLWDDIFPGGTKWGVETYVVTSDAVGEELILQSNCGGSEDRIARGIPSATE